ncbi:MAG TPA: 5'/3'-nucleotidase SurE [Negativicutes bacterium]|nr:5'/3'-nucleotidase SurE [Negativicutes bacterium]
MRILLTNDDGIAAAGINALLPVLCELGEVSIVAPDRERSATGHGITVHQPLRVQHYSVPGNCASAWMVDGTPADCVKLAVEALLPVKPDLVVSGINLGSNLGTDVLYSGTVSAAVEGVILGVPAVAVSLTEFNNADFTCAAQVTKGVILQMLKNGLPPNTLLNVNVPPGRKTDMQGIAVTKLGNRRYENTFDRREDPRGRVYYWLAGKPAEVTNDPDSDITAIEKGYISVSPVHFDLTNYRIMNQLEKWSMDDLLKTPISQEK